MTTFLHDLLRWLHIGTGLVALILFWVPALTKKGGRAHRQAGRWYVWMMGAVLTTAIPLSVASFWVGEWFVGVFLAYLAVVTGSSLWYGLAVLQVKPDATKFRTRAHALMGVSNLLAGIILLIVAWTVAPAGFARTLFTVFAFIGFTTAWDTRRFFRAPPTDRQWWRYEHMGGMIGTGIAAHTAFGAFGLRQVFPQLHSSPWGLVPWIAPTIIGISAVALLTRHYRKQYATGSVRAAGQATAAPASPSA